MKNRVSSGHAFALCMTFTAGCVVPSQLTGALYTGGTATGNPAPAGSAIPEGSAAKTKTPVTVRVVPDSIVMNEQTSQQLAATVQYADGTYDADVAWSSTDSSILAVNGTTGRVTAVKAGLASVVAYSTADASKRGVVVVSVRPAPVVDAIVRVAPAAAAISVGGTVQLSGSIQTSAGEVTSNFSWSTSNQAIAVVTNGLVTGVAPGKVTITATSLQDQTKKATASISVTSGN